MDKVNKPTYLITLKTEVCFALVHFKSKITVITLTSTELRVFVFWIKTNKSILVFTWIQMGHLKTDGLLQNNKNIEIISKFNNTV